jgi:hypothetical protein
MNRQLLTELELGFWVSWFYKQETRSRVGEPTRGSRICGCFKDYGGFVVLDTERDRVGKAINRASICAKYSRGPGHSISRRADNKRAPSMNRQLLAELELGFGYRSSINRKPLAGFVLCLRVNHLRIGFGGSK